jgi:hypothetical protein
MSGFTLNGFTLRRQRFWRLTWVAIAASLLVGCPKNRYDNIVVNDTGAPITVSFRLRHPDDRIGKPGVCGLTMYGNRMALATDEWSEAGVFTPLIAWARAPDQQQNLDTCSLQATVPQGHGLLVVRDDWCVDYREKASASGLDLNGIRPYVLELTVTTGRKKIHYEGWGATNIFVRQKSGHCFFRVK